MATYGPALQELVAQEDFWEPVEDDGSQFRTCRLRKSSEHRLEFRPSIQMLFLCSVIIAIEMLLGVLALLIALGVVSSTGENGQDATLQGTLTSGLIGVAFGSPAR